MVDGRWSLFVARIVDRSRSNTLNNQPHLVCESSRSSGSECESARESEYHSIATMFNALREAVSKGNRRFQDGAFDLDLTYITERIIGTAQLTKIHRSIAHDMIHTRVCMNMFVYD